MVRIEPDLQKISNAPASPVRKKIAPHQRNECTLIETGGPISSEWKHKKIGLIPSFLLRKMKIL